MLNRSNSADGAWPARVIGGEISAPAGAHSKTTKSMKTIAKLILVAGLIAGTAVPVLAGPGPQYWETLRKQSQFETVKPGDKVAYVCNQCQTVTEQTVQSTAETMDHCKEGATLTCPSCKMSVKVVMKGPPKNPMITREVSYVNDKGEECFFIAKLTDKK
jgi:DNA-directed RNA polymerase subunit RPC12/RpoP